MSEYWDEPIYADIEREARTHWRHERPDDDHPTRSDLADDPIGFHRLTNGPDPWQPYTCPKCGDETSAGMPATCPACGFRNYGRTTP